MIQQLPPTREGRRQRGKREKHSRSRSRKGANRDYTESDDAASLSAMSSSPRQTNATPVQRPRSRKRTSAATSAHKITALDIVSKHGSVKDSASFMLEVDAEEVDAEEVGSDSDSEKKEIDTEKNSEEDEILTDTDNDIDTDNEDNVSEYQQALREKFKLDVYPAKADGNCLFRSVAQQVFNA